MIKPTRAACLAISLAALSGCGFIVSSNHRTEDYTSVVAAASACNLADVRSAITVDRGLLMQTEWDDATLLHVAVGQNCDDLAEYLVSAGANVNAKKVGGITSLHLAAQRGNLLIVKLLLGHGAKLGARDSQGQTAAERAFQWGHPDVATYLKGQAH